MSCVTISHFADASGAVEAVVYGGLPGAGRRPLPDRVAARGPPQEVSSGQKQ